MFLCLFVCIDECVLRYVQIYGSVDLLLGVYTGRCVYVHMDVDPSVVWCGIVYVCVCVV